VTLDLVPLGDRVLIRPDTPKAQTDSGLHLVEHWPDEVSGVVVAVGRPKHPRKDEAFELAEMLDCDDCPSSGGRCLYCDAAQLLRELTGREPAVAIGDRVLFSRAAGQDVSIDETRYVLMREADLLAVLEAHE
jgi:co-chaperonin GroES (HSP10)